MMHALPMAGGPAGLCWASAGRRWLPAALAWAMGAAGWGAVTTAAAQEGRLPGLPAAMQASVPAPAASVARGLPAVSTPLFIVDGEPVYWPEFSYWLKHARKSLPPGTDTSVLARQAVDLARKRLALLEQAHRLGLEPNEQDLAEWRARRDKDIRIYGGLAEYRRIVGRSYVTEQVHEDLFKADLLGNRLLERLYGADGEKLPMEVFQRYVNDQQLVRARVLVLRNRTLQGQPDSGPAWRAKISLAQRLRAELSGRPGAEHIFERRVAELGEDQAGTLYPDGRILGAAPHDQALARLAAGLKPGEFAPVNVSADTVLLLQRLPLGPEHRPEAGAPTLRWLAAYQQLFGQEMSSWIAGQRVAFMPAFEQLDLQALLR